LTDDAAVLDEAERIARRDFPGSEVVSRELLRRTADGGAAVQFVVGFAGVGSRGPTMWVRVHAAPPE
jgi:hypothetical protein